MTHKILEYLVQQPENVQSVSDSKLATVFNISIDQIRNCLTRIDPNDARIIITKDEYSIGRNMNTNFVVKSGKYQ